jgi:hypothetical protein
MATFREIAPGLPFGSRLATFRRRQLYTRSPRFRETDGYGLLGRACPMFAFPYVLHFLAHEFTCLSGWRQTLAFIFARPFDWLFFWHSTIVSPLLRPLDVRKPRLHIGIGALPRFLESVADSSVDKRAIFPGRIC